MHAEQDYHRELRPASEGAEKGKLSFRPYDKPKLEKKRSVERATLFSGGGVTAGGLTASG